MKTTTHTNGAAWAFHREPEIEKHVPMTGRVRGTDLYHQRSLARKMEIGDSVFYPCEDTSKMQGRLSAAFIIEGKKIRPGRKFSTAQTKGGVRVWRVR